MPVEYGVRSANRYDIFALEALMKRALEESGGLLPPYDVDCFDDGAKALIRAGTVFVAVELSEDRKREKVVGCLALRPTTWHWNSNITLLESVHFYVLPEARKVRLHDGKTLIWEALLECGKQLANIASYRERPDGNTAFSATALRIDMLFSLGGEEGAADNRAIAKDEIMKRFGFQYVGGNHVFIPKEVQAEQAAA